MIFFAGKDSECLFRFSAHDGNFDFKIDGWPCSRLDYMEEILKDTEMEIWENPNAPERKGWIVQSNNATEFLEKITAITETLVNEYALTRNEVITEDLNLYAKARVKYREYPDTPEGYAEFREWFIEEMEKDYPDI